MHASILLAFTLLSSSFLLAVPVQHDHHPHLVRRQISILDTGIGAGAVDISRTNRKNIDAQRDRVRSLRDEVTFLKGREQMLQGGPRLQRRLIDTILGAVGIHKSKENRDLIVDMQHQVAGMRGDVNWMLQREHLGQESTSQLGDMGQQEVGGERDDGTMEQQDDGLTGPEESSPVTDDAAGVESPSSNADQPQLVRRQLGLILTPIALHKAHTDRNMLNALVPIVDALQADCARIRTAQEARLRFGGAAGLVNNQVTVASAWGSSPFNTPVAFTASSGVLAASDSRDGWGPEPDNNDGWVTGPTVDGGNFVPRSGNGFGRHTRSSAYGRPNSYN